VQHPRMKFRRRLPALAFTALALAVGLSACSEKKSPTNPNPTPGPTPGPTSVGLRLVGQVDSPTFLTGAPGDTSRLFVLEKGGAVRIIKSNNLLATPFLTVSVSTTAEMGLLGMAFDPAYQTNGRFYISYIDVNGDSKIDRRTVSGNPDIANTASQNILTLDQPDEDNHKGGMIAFGPDGYLWVSLGDGGGQEDPRHYGQTKTDLFGSMLRIDVSGNTGGYDIPNDNPFPPPALKELWDYGLRNPWRFSFDRQNGDLYVTDVGQYAHEEINVATAASGRCKGANYGWSITDGNDLPCYDPNSPCDKSGITMPVLTYDHVGNDCAVIGGYVYRGTAISGLQGTYFYGDHCAGWVKSFKLSGGFATQLKDWPSLDTNGNITSFGQDTRGELYVLTLGGKVLKIVPQ
jgi:glucose/arabinose dehydrogenase